MVCTQMRLQLLGVCAVARRGRARESVRESSARRTLEDVGHSPSSHRSIPEVSDTGIHLQRSAKAFSPVLTLRDPKHGQRRWSRRRRRSRTRHRQGREGRAIQEPAQRCASEPLQHSEAMSVLKVHRRGNVRALVCVCVTGLSYNVQQAQVPAEHRNCPQRRQVSLARLRHVMPCLLPL